MTSPKQDITAQEYNALTVLFQDDENLSFTFNNASWVAVTMMARACFRFTGAQLNHLEKKYLEIHDDR